MRVVECDICGETISADPTTSWWRAWASTSPPSTTAGPAGGARRAGGREAYDATDS